MEQLLQLSVINVAQHSLVGVMRGLPVHDYLKLNQLFALQFKFEDWKENAKY